MPSAEGPQAAGPLGPWGFWAEQQQQDSQPVGAQQGQAARPVLSGTVVPDAQARPQEESGIGANSNCGHICFSFSKEEEEGRHLGTQRGRLGERSPPSSVASTLVRRPGCCFDKCRFRFHLPARNLESKEISQAAEPWQTAGSGTEGVALLPLCPHPSLVASHTLQGWNSMWG